MIRRWAHGGHFFLFIRVRDLLRSEKRKRDNLREGKESTLEWVRGSKYLGGRESTFEWGRETEYLRGGSEKST